MKHLQTTEMAVFKLVTKLTQNADMKALRL